MLKVNASKYIWIIGVPRSGTTFLTDYLCKYASLCYNEPWGQCDINKPNKWEFPQHNTIVFKYCANWQNAKILDTRFKKSYFIHLIRHPAQVVHSMVYPKKNAIPYRNLFNATNTQERFKLAIAKWQEFILGSREVCKQYNGIEIVYEQLPEEIDQLAHFTKLPLVKKELRFKLKQANELELEKYWEMAQYASSLELRHRIEEEFFSKSLNLL